MSAFKRSQWPCIQQNIGTWHGAFVQFSPEGERVSETPSMLTLEETEPGKTMQLTLERTPSGGTKNVVQQSFHYPGPAPYVLFFESGSFSQGTPQWSSFGQFGAEFSLKVGDKRVRTVVMYESTQRYTSKIKYVTLICETQAGGTEFTESVPTVEQFLGDWTGPAQMISATMDPVITGNYHWRFNGGRLTCKEAFGDRENALVVVDPEKGLVTQPTDIHTSKVLLLKGDGETELTYQLMLFPKGAYCLIPQEIRKDCDFRLEAGWLSQAGDRARTDGLGCTRLIRYYDKRGVWLHSALVQDPKIQAPKNNS